jgi:Dynamin family
MNRYDDLRAQALELFPPLRSAARRAGAAETGRRLDSAQQRLEDSKLTVVVCGEFKRGKSTLLNALLEEPGLFPVDLSYATSLVTAVTYGSAERVTVRLASAPAAAPGEQEERTIGRAELVDYVTEGGNPGNGKHAIGAVIEIPSERLASGLTLVDTPGIGGVYTQHAVATGDVLPTADVIMFVADATQPLTSSELRFLRYAADAAGVRDDANALICVLTMKDKVTSSDEILASTRAKLAGATGWPRVPVVLVSSQGKLDFLDSQDEADLTESDFPELERLLWDTLSRRRAKAILSGALADLDTCADALIQPIAAELATLHADGAEGAAAFRDTMEARHRRLANLGVAAATWRGDLARESEGIAREVVARTTRTAELVRADLAGALADDTLLYDTDGLLRRVDDDVSMIMGAADRMLHERAARLQRELAGRLGLDLGYAGIGRLPAPPVAAIRDGDSSAEKPSGRSTGLPSGSTMISIGSTVGSVLGRLLEFFVAPGAGALIGGTIGAGTGVLIGGAFSLTKTRAGGNAGRPPREERRQAVQADLDQFYQRLHAHIRPAVTAAMTGFADAISAEIDSRIRQEAASTAAAARRAGEAAPADAERAADREAALNAERAPLDEARERVAELTTAALELSEGGGS